MTARLRPLVPAGLLLAAWPLGELCGALVGACGLSPFAFLAVLTGIAAAAGAAVGWGVRPTVATAAVGGFPLPVTANRVRGAAALAAFGAAALAAAVLSDEVRGRWSEREMIRVFGDRQSGPGPQLTPAGVRALAAFQTSSQQPDAYVRGVADRAGIAAPGRLTLGVYYAIPLTAGLLAAAVAWRAARPTDPPPETADDR